MPDDDLATAALHNLAERRPDLVTLARVASVAAIVEPPLLRRLRLEVPGLAPPGTALHAGTEADLWFSHLAHVATAGQFTLRPAIAETLRHQLREPQYQAVARAAHRIVQDAHAQHPDMIRLEERVIWSTIMGDAADVGRALDRALAAIRLGPERAAEVVRWVMQARRRLPPSALTHPAGRRLLTAVAMQTDRVVPAELLTAERFPDAVGDLAPTGLPLTTVGAELVEGGIRFVTGGGPTSATVTLPDTRPLVLEARWQDQDETAHSTVILAQPGTATALAGLTGPVVLRTLAGQRFRLRTAHTRQVVIAVFGVIWETVPGPSQIAEAAGVPEVTVRIDHEPTDIYTSKAEILLTGPYEPNAPGFQDYIQAFSRAAARAQPSAQPPASRGIPGLFVWSSEPGWGSIHLPWWDMASPAIDPGRLDPVNQLGSAVRAIAEHPARMYELDLDSALAMLHVLALAFHVRHFYGEEVGRDGEQQLFDLGDDRTDIDYWTFQHVLGLCEWIFSGPVPAYLVSGVDPTQDEPTPPTSYEAVPRDVSGHRPQDPGWSPFPTPWQSFAEYLTWFFQQLHRYAEFMRDRLGPRRILMGVTVPPDALEACRLSLGTAALPLGQDQSRRTPGGGQGVVFAVERARFPGLISALAEPVLEAARAQRRAGAADGVSWVAANGAPVTSVAFFPDGSLLVTAGSEPVARIWNTGTRQQVAVLSGHTGFVTALVVAPDGTWLATSSRDGTIRIWDARSWSLRTTLPGTFGMVSALTVAPDGAWLATGDGGDETVWLWNTGTWYRRAAISVESGGVFALGVAPDGSWLAVGTSGGRVSILDPVIGQVRATELGPGGGVSGLAVAPDGSWLAFGDNAGVVQIWDVYRTRGRRTITGRAGLPNPLAVGVTADGRILLATSNNSNSVQIWDPVNATLISEFAGHTGPVNALAFGPGANLLASASNDGTVRLWDVLTGLSA